MTELDPMKAYFDAWDENDDRDEIHLRQLKAVSEAAARRYDIEYNKARALSKVLIDALELAASSPISDLLHTATFEAHNAADAAYEKHQMRSDEVAFFEVRFWENKVFRAGVYIPTALSPVPSITVLRTPLQGGYRYRDGQVDRPATREEAKPILDEMKRAIDAIGNMKE